MITYSWAQFVSKDVPIYVHHMQPRFGQEIINNLLSQLCHVYSLYCNYIQIHVNICLKSIPVLHQNCSKHIPLSNTTANNTIPTRKLILNSTLNSEVHIFHYFFAKKSYLITAIQSKLVMGIICINGPILPHFNFFFTHLPK